MGSEVRVWVRYWVCKLPFVLALLLQPKFGHQVVIAFFLVPVSQTQINEPLIHATPRIRNGKLHFSRHSLVSTSPYGSGPRGIWWLGDVSLGDSQLASKRAVCSFPSDFLDPFHLFVSCQGGDLFNFIPFPLTVTTALMVMFVLLQCVPTLLLLTFRCEWCFRHFLLFSTEFFFFWSNLQGTGCALSIVEEVENN